MHWHVKHHIILENLKEYEYQGLDPGSNFLLNGIRCEKLSIVIVIVMALPDKYEKDFDAMVTFLTQYIDKWGPKLSVKVAYVT